jgi:hypothetical protein
VTRIRYRQWRFISRVRLNLGHDVSRRPTSRLHQQRICSAAMSPLRPKVVENEGIPVYGWWPVACRSSAFRDRQPTGGAHVVDEIVRRFDTSAAARRVRAVPGVPQSARPGTAPDLIDGKRIDRLISFGQLSMSVMADAQYRAGRAAILDQERAGIEVITGQKCAGALTTGTHHPTQCPIIFGKKFRPSKEKLDRSRSNGSITRSQIGSTAAHYPGYAPGKCRWMKRIRVLRRACCRVANAATAHCAAPGRSR